MEDEKKSRKVRVKRKIFEHNYLGSIAINQLAQAKKEEYGELKARLAKEHSHDMDAYMDGKDSFVKDHESLPFSG